MMRLHAKLKQTNGQALAEFVIVLVVLVLLISAVTSITTICLKQERLQRAARLEAGKEALTRTTIGWVDSTLGPETRSDPSHQINAITRLEDYSPSLQSRLPMSNYTLASHTFATSDLGLQTTTLSETLLLDQRFAQWIYGKGSIRLQSTITFPATTGLWE